MSRRRRNWRRYGRRSGVIINAERVIIERDEEDDPPVQFAVWELILGAMAGMLLMRLIDIGKVIVLQ
jgi:hypothetical protein